jgi:hypothetical protein
MNVNNNEKILLEFTEHADMQATYFRHILRKIRSKVAGALRICLQVPEWNIFKRDRQKGGD